MKELLLPQRGARGLTLRSSGRPVKTAKRQGFGLELHDGYRSRDRQTCLLIRGEAVGFRMIERVRRHEHEATASEKGWRSHTWDYTPTGILQLELTNAYSFSGRKRWRDSKREKLEDLLPAFLAGAFDAALAAKERARKWEEQRQQEREAERLRKQQEQQFREEQQRRDELEQQAECWKKSQALFAYIGEVERRAHQLALTGEQHEQMNAWLAWARAYAAQLNPLTGTLPFTREDEPDSP